MMRPLLLAFLPPLAAQAEGARNVLVPGACWGVAYAAPGDAPDPTSPLRSLVVKVPPAGFVRDLAEGETALFVEAEVWEEEGSLSLTVACAAEEEDMVCGGDPPGGFALTWQADETWIVVVPHEPVVEMDRAWALKGPAEDGGVHKLRALADCL